MDILDKLPEVFKIYIIYDLSHPCADMIRDSVEQVKFDSVVSIEGLLQDLDLEFDMRGFFISEQFVELKCERQRRLWRSKILSAENMIKTLMNEDRTTSEE